MTEILESNRAATSAAENQKLGRLFYILAALQILIIFGGAVLVLLVAPTSLFVSTTEGEAFFWIVSGFVGLVFIALGVILIPLSIAASRGISQEKTWGRIIGIVAAILAIFEFPLGTIFGGYLLWRLFRRR
ncbi:MAG: hypothetical protein M3R14_14120 [Acidobacteriota bacterium]|nr:hypothetical protein [Acidobacteriota bacterium]